MTATQSVLLVAGDPSGDMHGARLAEELKRRLPSLRVAAVGGPMLRARADEFLFDLASLGVTGFLEPVRQAPAFVKTATLINGFLKRRRPRAVVCIDFYGFNRRVLGLAKRHGVPRFYFISPQVWASRPGRVLAIKRLVDRMLVIFPFEERLYRKAGVPVSFVGHPLLDMLPEPRPQREPSSPLRLGLLPGSRPSELRRHLPLFLRAAEHLRKDFPKLQVQVFAASSLPDRAYAEALRGGASLVRESDYAQRSRLDLAFTSSGTATLENALLGVPMVVVYRMSWPTYAIARAMIRVPYISMANLLAGRLLVPELIQRQATPESIWQAGLRLLENPRAYGELRAELAGLRSLLGGSGAAARAAEAILEPAR